MLAIIGTNSSQLHAREAYDMRPSSYNFRIMVWSRYSQDSPQSPPPYRSPHSLALASTLRTQLGALGDKAWVVPDAVADIELLPGLA
jgi:hypothetical protein